MSKRQLLRQCFAAAACKLLPPPAHLCWCWCCIAPAGCRAAASAVGILAALAAAAMIRGDDDRTYLTFQPLLQCFGLLELPNSTVVGARLQLLLLFGTNRSSRTERKDAAALAPVQSSD
jgi:hypothetical protein